MCLWKKKCLKSIITDLVLTWHEIIESTKNVTINFNVKKTTLKIDILHISLPFLVVTIWPVLTVSIYYYYYCMKHI